MTIYRSSVGLPSLMSMERTGTSGAYWDPVIKNRTQLHCEVIYVVGGSGRIAVDGRSHGASAHDVFFIPPGVPLDLVTQEENKLDLLYVHFHMQNDHYYNRLSGPASFILQELESHNDEAYLTTLALPDHLPLPTGNQVERYLTDLLEVHETKAPGFYQRSCALLLIALHQLFDALMSAISAGATGTRYRTLVLARRIRTYIGDRPTTFSGASELSKAFRMNSQHLSRVFKRAYGESIVSFANRQRVAAAKYALINTDKSIAEVAEASGFKSANHFQRVFRSLAGLSPLEFRSTHPARSDSAARSAASPSHLP